MSHLQRPYRVRCGHGRRGHAGTHTGPFPWGTDEPHNLGIAHGSCNAEKGRRWDKKRRRTPEEYEALVQRFRERRLQRWRDAQ
ncbi:MAG: hypothetical protein M3441_12085 [Chloroflexota bacterium]|nr:hypothetical protein [Chloroflexota bacterium]